MLYILPAGNAIKKILHSFFCVAVFVGSVSLWVGWYSEMPSGICTVPTWWRHEMETFSALLAICAGNSPVPGEFPHKGQWRGALMFSLICVWINGWVNNRKAGDLRRYCIHYDVIVMDTLVALYCQRSLRGNSEKENHKNISSVSHKRARGFFCLDLCDCLSNCIGFVWP